MARVAASGQIVVLFDITGTLLHRKFREPVEGMRANVVDRAWHIYERPYAQEMVRELSEHPLVKIGIFTTMQDRNAKSFLSLMGLKEYFFFIYAQNEDLRWCESDLEHWNPDKNMYEWKKNLCNVFQHATDEVGFTVTEQNCVVVDDTPRKTRDYPDNVVVPARYDDAAVRGPDDHMYTLMNYLIGVAENFHGDVRNYMGANSFADYPRRDPSTPMMAPGPGQAMVSRGGSLLGASIQTLKDSNFKLFYDNAGKQEDGLSIENIRQHVMEWFTLRQVCNTSEVIRDLSDPTSAIRLWSSETEVCTRTAAGVKNQKFYRFINSELQRDDHKFMAHVAFMVRIFNSVLVQSFEPSADIAFRGAMLPYRKIAEFFERVLAGAEFFRIPKFFAVSLTSSVAEVFASKWEESQASSTPFSSDHLHSASGKGKGRGRGKGRGGGHGKSDPPPALQPLIFEVMLPSQLLHAKLLATGESLFSDEQEVLFPPYSLFKFHTLTKGPGIWRVRLEAMADNLMGGKDIEKVPCLFWA